MKSEKFVADESYGEWQGTYEVPMISAAVHMEIEDEIVKYVKKIGKDPANPKDYPTRYYNALCLVETATKDGEKLSFEPLELLKQIPNRLFIILVQLFQKQNEPSQEEMRFLLGQ